MKHFSRDPQRRREWLIKMQRGNWKPTDNSCLCEVHFAPEMWEKPCVDGKRILKSTAVPTLFYYTKPPTASELPFKRKLSSPKKQYDAGVENTGCEILSDIKVENTGASTGEISWKFEIQEPEYALASSEDL